MSTVNQFSFDLSVRQLTTDRSYMASEMGWLASVCSPHFSLTSRHSINDLVRSAASNIFALPHVCQAKTTTDKVVLVILQYLCDRARCTIVTVHFTVTIVG